MRASICYRIAFFMIQSVCVNFPSVNAAAVTQMESDMEQLTFNPQIDPSFLTQQYWFEKCQTDAERDALNKIFDALSSEELKTEFLTNFTLLIDGFFLNDVYLIQLMSLFYKLPSDQHKQFTNIMQQAPFFLDAPLSDGCIFFELAVLLSTTNPDDWLDFESCLSLFIYYDLFFEIPVLSNPHCSYLTFYEFFNFALIKRVPPIPASGDYLCRSIYELNDGSIRIILKKGKENKAAILNAMYAYLRTPKNESFFEEQEINDLVYQFFRNNTDINAHLNLEEIASNENIPINYFINAYKYFLMQAIKEFLQIYKEIYTVSDIENFAISRHIHPYILFNHCDMFITQLVHELFLVTNKENRDDYIKAYLAHHDGISIEKFMTCIDDYEAEIENIAERCFSDFCKKNTITEEYFLDVQDRANWVEKYASDPVKSRVLAFIKSNSFSFLNLHTLEYFFHLMKLHIEKIQSQMNAVQYGGKCV
ncbi:MAG: hypothetical protein HEEMFOPI_01309 [Holosporales bacterium]